MWCISDLLLRRKQNYTHYIPWWHGNYPVSKVGFFVALFFCNPKWNAKISTVKSFNFMGTTFHGLMNLFMDTCIHGLQIICNIIEVKNIFCWDLKFHSIMIAMLHDVLYVWAVVRRRRCTQTAQRRSRSRTRRSSTSSRTALRRASSLTALSSGWRRTATKPWSSPTASERSTPTSTRYRHILVLGHVVSVRLLNALNIVWFNLSLIAATYVDSCLL